MHRDPSPLLGLLVLFRFSRPLPYRLLVGLLRRRLRRPAPPPGPWLPQGALGPVSSMGRTRHRSIETNGVSSLELSHALPLPAAPSPPLSRRPSQPPPPATGSAIQPLLPPGAPRPVSSLERPLPFPPRGASLFHISMDWNSFIRARGASRPHGFGSLATSYGCRLRTMPTYLPWSPLWAS